MTWIRYRFRASIIDYRPIKFPPPGPYWCDGEGKNHSIVVAYLPEGVDVKEYWPEATEIEGVARGDIEFTDRFKRPAWWKDPT